MLTILYFIVFAFSGCYYRYMNQIADLEYKNDQLTREVSSLQTELAEIKANT